MNDFIVHMYKNNKIKILLFCLFILIFLMLFKIYYLGNVDYWNFIGAITFFIAFLIILYNASFLFVSKIHNDSKIFDYYVRFMYLLMFYSFSIYCVIR